MLVGDGWLSLTHPDPHMSKSKGYAEEINMLALMLGHFGMDKMGGVNELTSGLK